MPRRFTPLLGGAMLLLAASSRAEDTAGSRQAGSGRFLLDLDGSMGSSHVETVHEFGGPGVEGSGPAVDESRIALGAGVSGLYSPYPFWRLGPRVSVAELAPDTFNGSPIYTMEAGLLSVFSLHPSDTVGPRPRVILGAAWAWETLPAPRSFAIDHTVRPASGAATMVGLGFERPFQGSAGHWSLDLAFSHAIFHHEHSAVDTRTGERRNEQLEVLRSSVFLVFGCGWSFGGRG